jgi:SHS2 domain-containing protein
LAPEHPGTDADTARPGAGRGARHAFAEHTSEVEVRLQAPSLPALFAEAGLALAELLAGEPVGRSQGVDEPVRLESSDRDALLVDWLNELLFRSEMSGRVYTGFRIDRVTDVDLSATVGAVEDPPALVPVKAATIHGLRIAEGPDGFSANVVLDV